MLEWFPFYVQRLAGDIRYRALKDFQQAWTPSANQQAAVLLWSDRSHWA
jgi:hypothetical protein